MSRQPLRHCYEGSNPAMTGNVFIFWIASFLAMMNTNSRSRKDTGNTGELVAIRYLQEQWYEILATNYTIKGWELDIIAKKDGVFIFVEVKMRHDERHGHPLETFTLPKRRAMKRTVFLYLNTNHIPLESARIDFIAIMNKKDGTGYRLWHVRWVEIG